MAPHEDFLELCAAATAGELNGEERARLEAHLATCEECRKALKDYDLVSTHGMATLASKLAAAEKEEDTSWSVEDGEKALLKRLDGEESASRACAGAAESLKSGQRFGYRPSQIQWRDVWISLAAVVVLALALAVTTYRTGWKRGTDAARTEDKPLKDSGAPIEEQLSDAGHERAQLLARLAEEDKAIADLKRELGQQEKAMTALKASSSSVAHSPKEGQSSQDSDLHPAQELAAAEAKSLELQKKIDILTAQRDDVTVHSAALEAKVSELSDLLHDREREVDQKQEQVAKQQDLLEHDRDIRELMGARDLYIAEIHDVDGTGETNKTYGRVFYTRGKRLVFYAYDLDGQPGVRNASTFQAWGRRGPDKQQARNLGVFYEDNLTKKRWVLKADDPRTLEDIDAVFVTVEPNGGSPHPSGKELLFAYLRVKPNHP